MRDNTMNDKMMPPGDGEAKRDENLPPDPFDLTALRLSQDFVSMFGVKKLITTVRAKKPNKQDFFRVHPSPDYRAPVLMIHPQGRPGIFPGSHFFGGGARRRDGP